MWNRSICCHKTLHDLTRREEVPESRAPHPDDLQSREDEVRIVLTAIFHVCEAEIDQECAATNCSEELQKPCSHVKLRLVPHARQLSRSHANVEVAEEHPPGAASHDDAAGLECCGSDRADAGYERVAAVREADALERTVVFPFQIQEVHLKVREHRGPGEK